ncbi:hypothetical protein K8R66_03375 [bacterium]|nr:hypothetical protein [bacterium]
MANLFENKDRRVIPNWRTYKTTLKLGELDNLLNCKIENKIVSIDDYIFDWKQNKTIWHAGDLISAAYINNLLEDINVMDASKYILSNKNKCPDLLLVLANSIINPKESTDDTTTKELVNTVKAEQLFQYIKLFKKNLIKYPYNPIINAEISRLYSILGIKKKALFHMKIALHLAPENRFILRAAARLFAHFDEIGHEIGYIHSIIKKSYLVKKDPWITSTEIALSTIRNKTSKFIRTGLNMIDSNNFPSFNITELASSIGTLEFFNGNRRKTKKLLHKALLDPNDNSLAQVEWINNKDSLFEVNPENYAINNKYEAQALDNFYNNNMEKAYSYCEKWFYDLPFSKRPIMLGSHIANTFLKKPNLAIKLLEFGKTSHSNDPQILNNLSYSYALLNNLPEAENYINQIKTKTDIDITLKICMIATQGLINFRHKDYEKGRELYMKAIDLTKSLSDKYYKWLAVLNYAREELLIKQNHELIQNLIDKIPLNTEFNDINHLRLEIIDSICDNS